MLKITFKNVHQGDSIILEWKGDDGENKIGIIDCNLVDDHTNPVLSYLASSTYKKIEFILLSHPHYDHFSGIKQIIEHCEANHICINYFLHTSSQIPEFLASSIKSYEAKNELEALFKKVLHLSRKERLILHQGYVDSHSRDFKLNDDLTLRFLAPSTRELDKYTRNIPLARDEEDPRNKANANWLSTVIKIFSTNWFILLTSDVEVEVMKRLWVKQKNEFQNLNLLLGQSPHHGASKNHREEFWKNLYKNNSKIAFSVGRNHYKHPSKEAIHSFDKIGYKIYSTNKIGALESFTEEEVEVSSLLDIFSTLIPASTKNTELSGDQCFIINDNKIQYCPSKTQ